MYFIGAASAADAATMIVWPSASARAALDDLPTVEAFWPIAQ